MIADKVDSVFWFRRDLRLVDNHGLFVALSNHRNVLPVFIFDTHILQDLTDTFDKRVQFIYRELEALNIQLKNFNTAIHIFYGEPVEIFLNLQKEHNFKNLYANEDYEPYALSRDKAVEQVLAGRGASFQSFKDHVIYRPGEILKDNHIPYTIYTPYMKKWKEKMLPEEIPSFPSEQYLNRLKGGAPEKVISIQELGFNTTPFEYPSKNYTSTTFKEYASTRNFPFLEQGTSHLGIHLRFGTISIRQLVQKAKGFETSFLNELIWREFFIQVLYFHPHVVYACFRPAYEHIQWRNDLAEFDSWCKGKTGYALVDAGMRELNETGFMHNRVRMVVASFLCKHLLIDWRWGEAYFATKLNDYELASNNGNWQWAAGTGCDAAPYFRIFNPYAQVKKFDPQLKYVLKWAPEYGAIHLPNPMVDHVLARERALEAYSKAVKTVR